MKIKRVVISQPEPQNEKSPYSELAQKYGLKIDFRPFIHVEGVSSKEFRQQKISILDHTAVIFTSKTAVDHFFRICDEVRVNVPETMKYFCITESVALYLQKYIVYRKRKIFYGNNTLADLLQIMQKHRDEKYLLSLSDVHKPEIPKSLDKLKISYTKAIFYKTVSSDLSDLKDNFPYEMIVFYSPNGIKSLRDNFPNFEQSSIIIGAFGESTAKAVKDAGLRLDVTAPTPTCPSMALALDVFLKEYTKKTK